MARRSPPRWQKLVEQLQTGSDMEAVEASKELTNCRSHKCRESLRRLLRIHHRPRASELAAYALAWTHDSAEAPALVSCLRDTRHTPTTRGQAAEALGIVLQYRRRTSAHRRAETALLDCLADPSPEVRFWCCFALGSLRSKSALERLEHLKQTDTAILPGWWYVHEEAADAIERIAGRFGEDRIPVHMRDAENA